MKKLMLIGLIIHSFLASIGQTYTWTNKSTNKVKVRYEYNLPIGPNSNVLLSEEFNPSQERTWIIEPGGLTKATIEYGGGWNGKFATLIMGNCPTCSKPGNYSILPYSNPSAPPTA